MKTKNTTQRSKMASVAIELRNTKTPTLSVQEKNRAIRGNLSFYARTLKALEA